MRRNLDWLFVAALGLAATVFGAIKYLTYKVTLPDWSPAATEHYYDHEANKNMFLLMAVAGIVLLIIAIAKMRSRARLERRFAARLNRQDKMAHKATPRTKLFDQNAAGPAATFAAALGVPRANSGDFAVTRTIPERIKPSSR